MTNAPGGFTSCHDEYTCMSPSFVEDLYESNHNRHNDSNNIMLNH